MLFVCFSDILKHTKKHLSIAHMIYHHQQLLQTMFQCFTIYEQILFCCNFNIHFITSIFTSNGLSCVNSSLSVGFSPIVSLITSYALLPILSKALALLIKATLNSFCVFSSSNRQIFFLLMSFFLF